MNKALAALVLSKKSSEQDTPPLASRNPYMPLDMSLACPCTYAFMLVNLLHKPPLSDITNASQLEEAQPRTRLLKERNKNSPQAESATSAFRSNQSTQPGGHEPPRSNLISQADPLHHYDATAKKRAFEDQSTSQYDSSEDQDMSCRKASDTEKPPCKSKKITKGSVNVDFSGSGDLKEPSGDQASSIPSALGPPGSLTDPHKYPNTLHTAVCSIGTTQAPAAPPAGDQPGRPGRPGRPLPTGSSHQAALADPPGSAPGNPKADPQTNKSDPHAENKSDLRANKDDPQADKSDPRAKK